MNIRALLRAWNWLVLPFFLGHFSSWIQEHSWLCPFPVWTCSPWVHSGRWLTLDSELHDSWWLLWLWCSRTGTGIVHPESQRESRVKFSEFSVFLGTVGFTTTIYKLIFTGPRCLYSELVCVCVENTAWILGIRARALTIGGGASAI